MDPTITGAIIGAAATLVGAIIGLFEIKKRSQKKGYQEGFEEGFEKGRKHSLEKFMDEHEKLINRAIVHLSSGNFAGAHAACLAIVDNVMTWRDIQRSFEKLLNGAVNRLAEALRSDNREMVDQALRALKEGYEGKRLAVETELRRSRI